MTVVQVPSAVWVWLNCDGWNSGAFEMVTPSMYAEPAVEPLVVGPVDWSAVKAADSIRLRFARGVVEGAGGR